MLAHELAALFSRDLTRLVQELRAFPDTASLWKTVPGVSNAAGTLALHLEGGLRHFIGLRLGRIDYTRDRPLEFSARGVDRVELIARLEAVQASIPTVIAALTDAELDTVDPQNGTDKPLTTRQWLIHLYGHLSYHLGQIDYLRRVATGDGAIELAQL
jgi:DinB family protein